MKKFISVFLSLIMTLSVLSVIPAQAADGDTLKVAVATDIHTKVLTDTVPQENRDDTLYWQSVGTGTLYYESVAILRTFVDEAKAKGAEYILISGDLCTDGTVEEYAFLSKILGELEKSSGIEIYVVPGNHDFNGGATVADFKEYFADFGYNQALTVDEKTGSYTADLDDNYRLIGIDSNDHKTNGSNVDARLVRWIKQQAVQAKADGKQLIAMMHHPLMEHIMFHSIIMSDFVVNDWEYLSTTFADLGIKYCFTGHDHNSDIAEYTSLCGNEVYDVMTGTLTAYRPCYRMVEFSDDGVEFTLETMNSVNPDYLLDGYNDAQLTALTTDLQTYAKGYFEYCMETICKKFLDADYLNELTGNKISSLVDKVIPKAKEAVFAPLYGGDGSFESIAASYDVTLPETDYMSMFDAAMGVCYIYYCGDGNVTTDDARVQLIIRGVYVALKYALSDLSSSQKDTFVNTVTDALGIDLESMASGLTSAGVPCLKNVDGFALATAIIKPLAESFLCDETPEDSNVTLPAYSVPASADVFTIFKNLFARISEFFTKLVAYLNTLFGVVNG